MSGIRLRLAAAASAALQLALGFGLTVDLVVCTTASGHVAVESAYAADCCDDHVLPDGIRRLDEDEGCGCVDTPVLESAAGGRHRPEYAPSLEMLSLPPAAYLASRYGTAPLLRARAPEWALTVRRSVVLRV